MLRRLRLIKCAAAIMLIGGTLTQLGPCTVIAGQTALTSLSGTLIDQNGNFLFIFPVCGIPDVIPVDANGVPTGDVLFTEDDLLFGCPVTTVGP
jgi:hypothetical protein